TTLVSSPEGASPALAFREANTFIRDYGFLRLKLRLFFALCLLASGGLVYHVRGGVVDSVRHSDGFLDFGSAMIVPEVPDKYPLELLTTPSVDIVVGHARKDQAGAILVSGLARQTFGAPSLGPNMRIEVVVRGPHGEVVEQAATDCYLRSPGHGLAAQAHFALYLKSVPPPGSSVEISCRPA
ncbi:MAG: hypothetical protein WAM44_10810, partial [Chthoniobacterales bacterium]